MEADDRGFGGLRKFFPYFFKKKPRTEPKRSIIKSDYAGDIPF